MNRSSNRIKTLQTELARTGSAAGFHELAALKLAASATKCTFCAQRFNAGLEMYGGLGDRYSPGLHDTSHYLGPAINWSAPSGLTLSFSPQFGLNDHSLARIYRFGISYEISQIFGRMGRMGFHQRGDGRGYGK